MIRYSIRIVAALILLCSLSGCVALAVGGAAGAAGVMYHEGRLVDKVNAPLEKAYNASLATLESKKLIVSSKSADVASAHIKSKFANDKEIWIDIEAITSEVCEIKIRVGVMGDQDRSIELLEGIKARL
jgi:hypothetical protein